MSQLEHPERIQLERPKTRTPHSAWPLPLKWPFANPFPIFLLVSCLDRVEGILESNHGGVCVFDRAFDRAVRGRWTFVDQDIKLVVEFSLAYDLEPFFDSTRLGDGVVNDLALQAPNGMHFRAKSGVERGWVDGGAAEGLQVFDGIDLPGDSGA
jgi:hypothetical protein